MIESLGERITIVMYHYVRDLQDTRYPQIKGLDVKRFKGQLDYLEKHYSIIGSQTLLDSIRDGLPLPPRPCILTFDDGLMDHYDEVMPRLLDRGFTGLFFPITEATEQNKLLDVHKLHLILANSFDDDALLNDVFSLIEKIGGSEEGVKVKQEYVRYQNPRRFDSKPISYVKYLLQFGLKEEQRAEILNHLFEVRMDVSEKILAREWYVNKSHLRTMNSCGMEIGGHGRTHRWLDQLSKEEQYVEIKASLDMLKEIRGHSIDDWVMSYPFSGYNNDTLEIMKEIGCPMAVTTKTGLFSNSSDILQMPRLDTNDLPFHGDAKASSWTMMLLDQ